MSARAHAPGVGRPARGFTTARAQRWIIVTAVLTAVIYTFRRLVEPTTPSSTGSTRPSLARLAGSGPPAPLEQWAVSYTVAFLGLAILALGAPELAASLALMMLAGNLLTNGVTITADITHLNAQPTTSPPAPILSTTTAPAATTSAPGNASAPNMFQAPLSAFPPVHDPFTVPLSPNGAR